MEVAKDDATEISLEDAHKINKSLQLGDQVDVEIVPKDFWQNSSANSKTSNYSKIKRSRKET